MAKKKEKQPEFDYQAYEAECNRIRKENEEYLRIFEEDLEAKGLKPKTISNHISNVAFYINEYLLREEPREMEDGCYATSMFFSWFFIRKCMWSTPATIKSTAASFKKFYKSMLEHGKIDKSSYEDLLETIKEEMNDWCDECESYNGGSYDGWF